MTARATSSGDAMNEYRIPLIWMEYGHLNIQAESLEEAIEIALGPETPLPEGNYVDDSIQVDREVLHEFENKEEHDYA